MKKILRGRKSPEVKDFQADLITLGFQLPKYGVDGDFGGETEAAVKSFADSHGYVHVNGRITGWERDELDRMAREVLRKDQEDAAAEEEPCERSKREHGSFLWRSSAMSANEVLDLAVEVGLSRVYPKAMNKNGRPMYEAELSKSVPLLLAEGIEVIPWAYLDDKKGASDAERLSEIAKGLGCTGAIANMEREVVDGKTKTARAHDAGQVDDVLTVLSEKLDGFIGFSSFRRYDMQRFPREVLTSHAKRVVMMVQCYNEKTKAQSIKRVRESAESWLKDGTLDVRMTLGAFAETSSRSGKFGSRPEGMVAGGTEVFSMSAENPRLDPGLDWWTMDMFRHDYCPAEFRDSIILLHKK